MFGTILQDVSEARDPSAFARAARCDTPLPRALVGRYLSVPVATTKPLATCRTSTPQKDTTDVGDEPVAELYTMDNLAGRLEGFLAAGRV